MPIEVIGRVPGASNTVFSALAGDRQTDGFKCVYKPAAGERPLWDFPGMILARHEVAAYQASEALELSVVPPTVWREDLPHGPGAVQVWVDAETTADVEVFEAREVPAGWLAVMGGEDGLGRQVVVAHRDTPRLADIALFDVVINNSDRKAGHLLGDGAGVMGIDHGVAFHHEWKLRTVLWGFAGRALTAGQIDTLVKFRDAVGAGLPLDGIGLQGRAALLRRVHDLLESGQYPHPRPGWPVVPWPLW